MAETVSPETVTIELVFEAPNLDASTFTAWPVASAPPFSFLPISSTADEKIVGSFIAKLIEYQKPFPPRTVETALNKFLKKSGLILSGGIRVSRGEDSIEPGCCCGVEGWRSWVESINAGITPWWGHDPEPWARPEGDSILFYWNGAFGIHDAVFAFDFPRSAFKENAGQVEREFSGFLERVRNWADSYQFTETKRLVRKLDRAFNRLEPGPNQN